MRQVTLVRTETSAEGTFGVLKTDSGFECATGELPWRDNAPNKSSIPAGIYECTWRESPKHGMCYHVENVPGRTDIEIHSANFMGSADEGFQCDLAGCIALGLEAGEMEGQKAILFSKSAITGFEHDLNYETFELTIEDETTSSTLAPYDYH
jgi:hypothetical protein